MSDQTSPAAGAGVGPSAAGCGAVPWAALVMRRCLIIVSLLLPVGIVNAEEAQAECSGCHAEAPVPDVHPVTAEVSASTCGMCHGTGTSYFVAVHTKHPEVGVSCASCHGAEAANDELKAQLRRTLGR